MNGQLSRATALTVAALLGSAAVGACSNESSNDDNVGSITAALQLAPGIALGTVAYTVSGPGGYAQAGSFDVSASSILSAVISPLPSGTTYSIQLDATASDGTTVCSGSATFMVRTQMTTVVPVHVLCHQPTRNGSARVNGTLNVCPTIDGLSANPGEVLVGSSLTLSSTAVDIDVGPSPVSYQWSAPSGTFGSPGAQNTTFVCTTAGMTTITLTVSDGDPSPGCPDVQTVTVTCSPTP